MRETRNIQNLKSFLSAIDKMNTNSKKRKYSKQKENYMKKMNQTEDHSNHNLSKNENNSEYNLIYQITNNDMNNQTSLTKNKHNNMIHKRSLSKNIFNNINNYNAINKKNNISSDKMNNNSKDNNNQILLINKGKGIVLNKVNIFKNVKFRKPSLIKNISKMNKIDNKLNSNNSNTNTIVQSVSSLNMTSTDITASTKRIKDSNTFSKDNKIIKEKENNKEIKIFRNNTNYLNHNQNKESNTIDLKKNNKHNINKQLFNITNNHSNNPSFSNFNTNNNINTVYQFYKGILPNTNNLLNINKNKKPKNINIKYLKKCNKIQKTKNLKNKRCASQNNYQDISKKIVKTKKNLSLNTISNSISKKEDCGGTIISDDSVFNISKRRSSSGTHNDSSKISKGSGTMSFDKKSKSISIDYTYSDDEVQTNRRKKGNQIQIDNENDKNINQIYIKENDVKINNNEFKNFCDDLSSKLFGYKI